MTFFYSKLISNGYLQEREIVRKILYGWNAIHADEKSVVLLPLGWETHSAPDMSGPAQSVINRQVLVSSDLLVGIFWARIGTATEEYISGTVEEIERHIASGKPAMLYFSDAPVSPSQLNKIQYEALEKFRDKCKSKGLYEPFDSIAAFEAKFRHQLALGLNENYFKAGKQSISESPRKELSLLETLSSEAKDLLKIGGRDTHGLIQNLGGDVYSNNRLFGNGSVRETAFWEEVVNSLEKEGLIKATNSKRELFSVTDKGFKIIEAITNE